MIAFDGASAIFHTSVAVARYVHDRAEGIAACVRGDSALSGPCTTRGDTHFFGFSLVRAGGDHRFTVPGSCPVTAFAALTIAGRDERLDYAVAAARRLWMRRAPRREQ